MKAKIKIQLMSICILITFFLTGCATTTNFRVSSSFPTKYNNIKTIAVLPINIKVYKLTAGGVREQIDQWDIKAKDLISGSLNRYLGERYNLNIKFISEESLDKSSQVLWISSKALCEAIIMSILMHAYFGPNAFIYKLNNLDYSLGPEVNNFAKINKADALIFINGYDHEATNGRVALTYWNYFLGALSGVTKVLLNPSFMNITIVDASNGDILYFNFSPIDSEYSFRSKRDIDKLIEFLTRDFKVNK